jgi:hypothetical protein
MAGCCSRFPPGMADREGEIHGSGGGGVFSVTFLTMEMETVGIPAVSIDLASGMSITP